MANGRLDGSVIEAITIPPLPACVWRHISVHAHNHNHGLDIFYTYAFAYVPRLTAPIKIGS